MAGKVCDVCGGEAVGVCSSACGAISFAYCKDCLQNGAEPFSALAGSFYGIRQGEHNTSLDTTIIASCKVANKTVDEFWSEVDKLTAEMDAFCIEMDQYQPGEG
jgi:hypothetical protein